MSNLSDEVELWLGTHGHMRTNKTAVSLVSRCQEEIRTLNLHVKALRTGHDQYNTELKRLQSILRKQVY